MTHRIGMLICGVALTLSSAGASARVAPILREGAHPSWFAAGIGPSIGLRNAPNQLLLVQTFGHHFSSDASGPAIAVDMQEHVAGGLFVFQVGPRFVYDVRLIDGLGFYLSPSTGLEYTFSSSGPHHGFSVPVLFRIKLVLGGRGLAFFQPVGIDLMALFRSDSSHTAMQYELLFGGGVIF